jgi:hypothetical protein
MRFTGSLNLDFDDEQIDELDYDAQKIRVKKWVSLAPGMFTVRDLDREMGYETSQDFHMRIKILQDLVHEHIIENYKDKRGFYRPFSSKLEVIDYKKADGNSLDLWLPLGLHNMVKIFPGVIVIAGEPNVGKTAMVLNLIRYNMHKWKTHYFNSEMSAMELRLRLSQFHELGLNDWTFTPYARADNFSDVIFKDELNIIDFLEIHDEFYKVGGLLKDIHDKVGNGIAIVCIQKNPGSDQGLGGFRTLEVARLAFAIKPGVMKIVKAKAWQNGRPNPNGYRARFKLLHGSDFIIQGTWGRDNTKGDSFEKEADYQS